MADKKVLIYGGKGGLGNVLVNHFKSNGWFVASVDLVANDAADVNVVVNPNDDWIKQVFKMGFKLTSSSNRSDSQPSNGKHFQDWGEKN